MSDSFARLKVHTIIPGRPPIWNDKQSMEHSTAVSVGLTSATLWNLIFVLRKISIVWFWGVVVFLKRDYNKVKTIVLDRKSRNIKKPKWDSNGKVFPGVLTYDRRSHCHKKVSRLVHSCGLPKKYQLPLPNRGKKLWQFHFKKRVYIQDMDLLVEELSAKK